MSEDEMKLTCERCEGEINSGNIVVITEDERGKEEKRERYFCKKCWAVILEAGGHRNGFPVQPFKLLGE